MLTLPKLKNYLHLLLTESKSLPELEAHYADDIQHLNQHFFAQQEAQVHGWAGLNDLSYALRSIPDNYDIQSPQSKMYYIQQVLLSQGYQLIGQGFYRQVYSQPSTPWVIKLQRSGHINAREYDTYFTYGQTGDWVRYDLFPKLYDIDPDGAMWSIWEKVKPLTPATESKHLQTMFPRFTQQLQDIRQHLQLPTWAPPFHTRLKFKTHLLPLLNHLIDNLESPRPQPLQARYQDILLLLLPLFNLDPNIPYLNSSQLEAIVKTLPIPPDIKYLYDFFSNAEGQPLLLHDLKVDNLGYRNLKDHPTEPWRNLVILDLGEF